MGMLVLVEGSVFAVRVGTGEVRDRGGGVDQGGMTLVTNSSQICQLCQISILLVAGPQELRAALTSSKNMTGFPPSAPVALGQLLQRMKRWTRVGAASKAYWALLTFIK